MREIRYAATSQRRASMFNNGEAKRMRWDVLALGADGQRHTWAEHTTTRREAKARALASCERYTLTLASVRRGSN